jgi:MarR family 2-MHQ and catechol resistance regulon transcriptional repressor
MVERIRSIEDKRFVRVGLTGEGSAFVERVLPVYMQRVREEFAVLTVDEQQELGRLCRKLGLQQIEESEA